MTTTPRTTATALPYDMARVSGILAAPGSASALFAYLLEGLNRDVGSGLTTASVYDLDAMRSRRVYSQDPEAYPPGNYKPIKRDRYFETVIEKAQPFHSTSIEGMADVFFDWRKIQALGFESNLNLPGVANGRMIGTVNMLHEAGHFTPERVAAALAWQPVVTLCFLLLWQDDPENHSFTGPLPQGDGARMEGP